jgi:predicted RNA-binding protein YlqC (UPF0109 family)
MKTKPPAVKPPRPKLVRVNESPTSDDVTDILCRVILAFTRYHDSLKIAVVELGDTLKVSIKCHADDHPKVVGMGGKQIWSIKYLIGRMAERVGCPIEITLHDPTEGERQQAPKFKATPNWKHEAVLKLFENLLQLVLKLPFQYKFVPIDDQLSGIEFRVNDLELPTIRGNVTSALKNIFNAIGRHEGHNLVVELKDASPADPPPAISEIKTVDIRPLPPPPVVPDDDIAREARSRGFKVD